MKRSTNQGFTLVEVMLVLCLVGVMASLAVPPFFRYLASNELVTQTDRMVADMQYARSLSVANSQILRFTATAAGYQVTNPLTGVVIRQNNFSHGLVLDSSQTADFFPWGMANQKVFNLHGNAGTKRITLLPTGLVEVQ